jgi:hypothetical protein
MIQKLGTWHKRQCKVEIMVFTEIFLIKIDFAVSKIDKYKPRIDKIHTNNRINLSWHFNTPK